MKFLLNMNAPPQLGRLLQQDGHAWRHVATLGMAKATDAEIIVEARGNQEVIITHDLDYGHLLAFSGEPSPSVIIFRVRNTQPSHLHSRITSAWTEIERPLHDGAIVTMEDATMRIRRLPISRRN